MSAVAPPSNHHHLSFKGYYSLSSCLPLATCPFYPPLRLYAFRPQNSLQTNNSSQHSQPKSSALHSKNSTPVPSVPSKNQSDPELKAVLELATNSELFELEGILFGPSFFSPLLKSVTNGVEFDRFMIEEEFEERERLIQVLESRFLYLAADARSTLRGWRPSYRNVLLDVRKQLNVPCSKKLSSEDLEVEIFIHLVQKCARDWNNATALRVGAAEFCSMLLKGGQLMCLLEVSQLVSTRLSTKMLLEAAKHKMESKVIEKGFTGVASRYMGFRSLATFLGPMLWGSFLADIVIQMLGTDYIRVLQAIYALAQIRILRKHGLHLDKLRTGF